VRDALAAAPVPGVQGDAAPEIRGEWKNTECLYCWNCDDVCPQNAVQFGFGRKGDAAAMNLGRRMVIASVLTGVRIRSPAADRHPYERRFFQIPSSIRPPGLT